MDGVEQIASVIEAVEEWAGAAMDDASLSKVAALIRDNFVVQAGAYYRRDLISCPVDRTPLTSLLLCPQCGARYELCPMAGRSP